jgi:protein-L-isoaspartate(D-aspartate) O-methyltransferase
VKEGAEAPFGKRYVHFENETPGRGSRMLQGLALDGRQVRGVEISVSVRGSLIGAGQTTDQLPMVTVVFYDQSRAIIGRDFIGPWHGSFDWRRESGRIRVPTQAREAIVHLGLFGGTGDLDIDGVELRPLHANELRPTTDIKARKK